MLISRTPLRISLGGGGTDLPSYYRRYGGFVLSAAIDKHVYIAVNRTFTDDYFLKYSQLERVSGPGEIRHPIMRAALELHPVGPSV
ncbi:MAG TPA: galactokinase, partial [Actinomycetota bacterium]|nr:galactokinase [Actinomycetota bacterium]